MLSSLVRRDQGHALRLDLFILFTFLFSIFFNTSCEDRSWNYASNSLEELGQNVVDSLNLSSLEKLHQIRVSQQEYQGWVLPAFPETGFPDDFTWNNLNKNCLIAASRSVQNYGQGELKFVSLEFEDSARNYRGFRLLRGSVLTVLREKEEVKLRFLGSVIQKGTQYKFLSYKD